jgi:ZIP family zinc transporter
MIFPIWLQAGLWGLLAGSALLVGAAAGYFARVPQRVIAAIMAFGGGVLISALSFDLMDEAYKRGGFDSTAVGFLGARPCIRRRTGCWRGTARSTASVRAGSRRPRRKTAGAGWRLPWARSSTASRNQSSSA